MENTKAFSIYIITAFLITNGYQPTTASIPIDCEDMLSFLCMKISEKLGRSSSINGTVPKNTTVTNVTKVVNISINNTECSKLNASNITSSIDSLYFRANLPPASWHSIDFSKINWDDHPSKSKSNLFGLHLLTTRLLDAVKRQMGSDTTANNNNSSANATNVALNNTLTKLITAQQKTCNCSMIIGLSQKLLGKVGQSSIKNKFGQCYSSSPRCNIDNILLPLTTAFTVAILLFLY